MPLQTAQRPTAPTTPHDTAQPSPEAKTPQPPAEVHDEDHVIRGYD
ncbi:hypothetical protein SAMN02982929_00198 [Saccharopolyspora kobensis]|uniref:Uncharacterized protein n=1 Tax=Saccharopolyspora kobensis TaxID=146035 RepID=A0A1H5TFR1_9PSEU|nr:hypothetical protein [Saccharopolyspora kobensis]SEF60921.1 hypothetical protein SAMN02982929_00198 [Saccharopolyspora kobensis]SFC47436.1 hypothetical protein SAMN05216506_101834 [Saccharopolyspora kobensis]